MADRRRPTVEGGSPDPAGETFRLDQSSVGASFGRTQSGYRLSFARDRAVDDGERMPARRKLTWLGRSNRGQPEPGEARDSQRHDVVHIPISDIKPTETTARRRFDLEDLEALSRSLLDKGMLHPVLVRQTEDGGLQLIAGYRRWLAADLAGMTEVPAIIIDRVDEGEALEFALIENLQRRDLTIMEEAQAHNTLIERFGRTHAQVAELVGKSRSHVSNTVRLLALPQEVREMLEADRLAYGHARALLSSADPVHLAHSIVAGKLTVRAAERMAARSRKIGEATIIPLPRPSGGGGVPSAAKPAETEDPADPGNAAAVDQLRREIELLVGLKVDIDMRAGNASFRMSATSPTQILSAAQLVKDALELHSLTNLIKDASDIGSTDGLPLRSSR